MDCMVSDTIRKYRRVSRPQLGWGWEIVAAERYFSFFLLRQIDWNRKFGNCYGDEFNMYKRKTTLSRFQCTLAKAIAYLLRWGKGAKLLMRQDNIFTNVAGYSEPI